MIVNRLSTALAAFALLAIISPVTAQTEPDKPFISPAAETAGPVPVREILPGGLHLIVEERKDSPVTAIEIRVRVGSSRETAAENGIAHFIEHLLFKGSTARASGEVDTEIENLGGEISAKTTRDATQFSTVVPSANWKKALALLTEALLSPAFREPDIKTEAKVIAAEMAVARTDPEKNGFSRLASVVYHPTDSARLPLMGTESNLATFTPDALRAFHKTWYRPGNITVAIVGDVGQEDVRKFAEFLFHADGGRPVEKKSEVSVYAPLGRVMHAAPVPAFEQKGRDLTTVLVGFRVPAIRNDETLPVFDTLMPALANGRFGRLVDRLVKKEGIALSVAADFVPGRNAGLILITVMTRPRLAPLVEKSLLDEVERLREDTLTADEADKAVAAVLGRIGYLNQAVEERAAWLAMLDVAAPLVEPAGYVKAVAAVKAEDLNRLISLYLTPVAYAVAEIGPPPPKENPDESAAPGVSQTRDGEAIR